jgi:oxaloacetate decarboxylase alpha subunit/pyruvate carboxylase subunit B
MVKKRDELVKKALAGELIEKKADSPVKTANLRTFNVFIDGEHFNVEVDPIGGPVVAVPPAPVAGPVATAPAPVQASAQAAASSPAPAPAQQPSGDTAGTHLLAPMPGMIVKYRKNVGDTVVKGEATVVLEAMKMENALPSPCDGVIKSIPFKSGDTVAKGASLCVIG